MLFRYDTTVFCYVLQTDLVPCVLNYALESQKRMEELDVKTDYIGLFKSEMELFCQ